MTPYNEWPTDRDARWVQAADTFGRHLMAAARDYAFDRIPVDATPEARTLAQRAALDAIYGVMMLLDGVSDSRIDDEHSVEYVLSSRVLLTPEPVRTAELRPLEEIELCPEGDGLCMGYHGWLETMDDTAG